MKTREFKSLFVSLLALHLVFGIGFATDIMASTGAGNNYDRKGNQKREIRSWGMGRVSRWLKNCLSWLMSPFTYNERIREAEERLAEQRRHSTEEEERAIEAERRATEVGEQLAELEGHATEAERQNAEVGERLAVIRRDATEVDERVRGEEERLAELERRATEVQEHLTGLRASVTEAERRAAEAEERTAEIDEQVTELRRRVTEQGNLAYADNNGVGVETHVHLTGLGFRMNVLDEGENLEGNIDIPFEIDTDTVYYDDNGRHVIHNSHRILTSPLNVRRRDINRNAGNLCRNNIPVRANPNVAVGTITSTATSNNMSSSNQNSLTSSSNVNFLAPTTGSSVGSSFLYTFPPFDDEGDGEDGGEI
ncbi:hypothetical protein FACS1894152_5380 [Bacilli bacterium]|nr:hypothetical protein FACS1894152_5380 [Bacilli bacterium]